MVGKHHVLPTKTHDHMDSGCKRRFHLQVSQLVWWFPECLLILGVGSRSYQWYACSNRSLEGVVYSSAMDLEIPIFSLPDSTVCDVVVRPNFISAGFTVVTTQVHHSTVFTDIHLPKGVLVTLFGVRKQAVGGRTWLLRTENTVILEHSTIDMDKFKVNL